jgi:N-acyl-D-aspartate/D-glutamate deacylase
MPIPVEPYLTQDLDVDLSSMPNCHPRGAGCYTKTLRLGREQGVPLMHTITSCSYTPAKHLGDCGLKAMQERGRIQEGMIADITIFDPKTVTDKSTYTQGCNPAEGIPYVIVSGKAVVKDSNIVHGLHPGQPIRFEKLTESRRTPLDVKTWKKENTVTKIDFGGSDPNQSFSACGCI